MILPTTELQLPALRAAFSAANGALGTAIASFTVTATQLGGFFAQPFRIPEDYDRSREGRLYAFLGNLAVIGPAAGNVVLDTVRSTAAPNASPVDAAVSVVQAIPALWPASQWLQVEIGTPAAPFLPPNSLPQLGIIGIRLLRNGPAVADTWASTINVIAFLLLRYHRLCLHCTLC